MVVKHDSKRLLQKLKKRVKFLQKKEVKARIELQAALKKVHHLAHKSKIKLAMKARVMEDEIADVRNKSYVKIIKELEDMIIRGYKTRGKALRSVIDKLDTHPPRKKLKSKAKKRGKR